MSMNVNQCQSMSINVNQCQSQSPSHDASHHYMMPVTISHHHMMTVNASQPCSTMTDCRAPILQLTIVISHHPLTTVHNHGRLPSTMTKRTLMTIRTKVHFFGHFFAG